MDFGTVAHRNYRPRRLISFKRLYSQAKMKTFQYPGVNLNLRIGNSPWEDSRDDPMYPIGVPESSGSESAILPVREVAMMMFMDKITDKPRWYEKVFDEAIVQKWREEVRQKPEDDLFKRIMQDKERNKIPKPHSRIISQASFEFVGVIWTFSSLELTNGESALKSCGIRRNTLPSLGSSLPMIRQAIQLSNRIARSTRVCMMAW